MKALLALALLTTAAQADEAWPTFGNPNAFTEQAGEAIYQSVCAGCHMPDGRGASGAGTYPSLQADPRLAASAYPVALVLKGQRAMPPLGQFLTNQQVAAVVTYIRTRFGNNFTEVVTTADVAPLR